MRVTITEETAKSLLNSCNSISFLKQIHTQFLKSNFHQNPSFFSSLLTLYSSLSPHNFPITNLHSTLSPFHSPLLYYNQTIRTFSKNQSLCYQALFLYAHMVGRGVRPDNYTYPFVIKACSGLKEVKFGREVHGRVLKSGYCLVLEINNGLIDMYGKCGEVGFARKVFDEMRVVGRDVVSYNAVLGAYARCGKGMEEARKVFDEMSVRKNVISWNAMVVGYANVGDLVSAKAVFDGMPERDVVSWTTMLVGYTKNGLMDLAKGVFDDMPKKCVVCWTAMISGFAQNGRADEALAYFERMERARVKPDAFTMSSVISALAQLGRPDLANWITGVVEREGVERNERVLTALVDMHAKCSNIELACRFFEEIRQPDVFPYSALITGLASHGHALRALDYFEKMQIARVVPDYITFVGVFNACSHAGLVEEGLKYWDSMIYDYKIQPCADHYACVVDMLGRAGRLEQAYSMVQGMPIGAHPGALGALLAACRTYDNVDIAEVVAQELFELEPHNTGNYMLLSGIYASREQWEDAERVRNAMKERIVAKLPGHSWV